jgi:hypothetical protein
VARVTDDRLARVVIGIELVVGRAGVDALSIVPNQADGTHSAVLAKQTTRARALGALALARVAGVCLACVVNGVEVAIRIATVHTDAVLLDETGSAGDTIGGAFTNALITTPVTIGARRATRGLVLILRQADIGTHAAVHNKKVVVKIAIDAVGGRGAGASETRPTARLADVAPEFA